MHWILLIGVIYMDGSGAVYELRVNDCRAAFDGAVQAIGPSKHIVGICRPIA